MRTRRCGRFLVALAFVPTAVLFMAGAARAETPPAWTLTVQGSCVGDTWADVGAVSVGEGTTTFSVTLTRDSLDAACDPGLVGIQYGGAIRWVAVDSGGSTWTLSPDAPSYMYLADDFSYAQYCGVAVGSPCDGTLGVTTTADTWSTLGPASSAGLAVAVARDAYWFTHGGSIVYEGGLRLVDTAPPPTDPPPTDPPATDGPVVISGFTGAAGAAVEAIQYALGLGMAVVVALLGGILAVVGLRRH